MSDVQSAVPSPLPPLAGRLGPFAGFRSDRSRQEQIADLLRPLASGAQGDQPVPFHGLREVCAHFGVSLCTAGLVYRRLEREGLLARLRGAGTVVPARSGARRPPPRVRGVVAIVNWLPGFLCIGDQRLFVMHLEEQFWRRGFVCEILFYHEEEKRSPAFAQRILAHRPDYVVWLVPNAVDETTMATLADAGVRVVTVTDQPVRTPMPQYVLDWRAGYAEAMHAWHRTGMQRVTVPSRLPREPAESGSVSDAARDQGMKVTFTMPGRLRMDDYVSRLARQSGGVVFDFDMWQTRLCVQAPEAFVRLLARRRVLSRCLLPLSSQVLGDAHIDMLDMPWPQIVRRIVDDVNTGALLRLTCDQVFQPVYRPRVPARRFARAYAYENV
jgi:hypothetical protein